MNELTSGILTVQVCWVGKGDEMRLSKELKIEAETGEVVGLKNHDTI